MDLMYTNAKRVDQGVLSAYALDLSFGADENNFELTLGADEPILEFGAIVYMEGTEYGGIIDAMKTSTNGESITYIGRTWHGILNSKVIEPDAGEGYLEVGGDANRLLEYLVNRLGLWGLFIVPDGNAKINIFHHRFARYCKGYDGIRDLLEENGAKLMVVWEDRSICLSAVPIVDYREAPIDGDVATLTVEQHKNKVNHLVCLGKGQLTNREVIHLYANQFGQISDTPYYTGIDEVADVYENSNSDDLEKDGKKKLKELWSKDTAEIALTENDFVYDIGDIVGATDAKSGVSVDETVTQKIVKINNGAVSIDYKTGG